VVTAPDRGSKLDPATLRRFVFKLWLRPINRDQAARAFERFFGPVSPAGRDAMMALTSGQFRGGEADRRQLGRA